MWLALGTRPDLVYMVSIIGQYSVNLKASHWALAKRALRYLKGTRDLAIIFDGSDVSPDMDFHRYTDANWSGDVNSSRSTSGYVFISN